MIELSPRLVADIPKNGPTDPIEFYRRPLVGWLFRERINRGLRLLPARRYERALEIGYGSGAVQIALADSVAELHGIDLDADPTVAEGLLRHRGHEPHLVKGSVYELPYPDAHFDLAVSFSVFEHLDRYKKGLSEVARTLRSGGLFLLGMPSVNKMMEAGFRLIGFKGIEDHHVTTPADVKRAFGDAGLSVRSADHLGMPLRAPLGVRLYHVWLLEKR